MRTCIALLAVVVTAALAATAFAGGANKCIEKPEPIYMDDELDVHANGNVHRDGGPEGKLSPAALERFIAFRDSGAKPAKVSKCLAALARNEKSKAAKRACRVKKKRR